MKVIINNGDEKEFTGDAPSVRAASVALAQAVHDLPWPVDVVPADSPVARVLTPQPLRENAGRENVFVQLANGAWHRATVGAADVESTTQTAAPEPATPDAAIEAPTTPDAAIEAPATPDAAIEAPATPDAAIEAQLPPAPAALAWEVGHALVIELNETASAFADAMASAITGIQGRSPEAVTEAANYFGRGMEDLVTTRSGVVGIAVEVPGAESPDSGVRILLARAPTGIDLKEVVQGARAFLRRKNAGWDAPVRILAVSVIQTSRLNLDV